MILTISILFFSGICLAASDDGTQKNQTPDKRLEQKVNIKATGMPLGDFFTKLSAKTGVKMTARKDVADDKLAIYVKDLPLSDLQDAVKEVLHLHCTRKGEKDKWEYEFWMDLKTKQEGERLKQEALDRLRKHIEDQIQKPLKSDEELRQDGLDEEYILHNRQIALQYKAVLNAYSSLNKTQLNTLWHDGRILVERSYLPISIRDKILASLNQRADILNEMHKKWLAEQPPDEAEKEQPPRALTIITKWNTFDSVELILDQKNPTKLCLRCKIKGTASWLWNDGDISTLPASEAVTFYEPMEESLDHENSEISEDISKTPAEKERVKLNIKKPINRYQLLVKIAELKGIQLVSDYFTCLTGRLWQPDEFKEVVPDDLFFAIVNKREFTIAEKNDLFLISTKKWPDLRAWEIPERILAKYRKIKKERGYLGITEAIGLTILTDQQLDDLYLYGFADGHAILSNRRLLTFLKSLTAQQWRLAVTDEGLLLSELRPAQYKLLLEWSQSSETMASMWHKDTTDEKSESIVKAITLEKLDKDINKVVIEDWFFGIIQNDGMKSASSLCLDGLNYPLVDVEVESDL